jgi:hypothetical protein
MRLQQVFARLTLGVVCVLAFVLCGSWSWAKDNDKGNEKTPDTRSLPLPGKPYPASRTKGKGKVKAPKKRIPGRRYRPLDRNEKTTTPSWPIPGRRFRGADARRRPVRRRAVIRRMSPRGQPKKSQSVLVIDPANINKRGFGVPLSKDSQGVLKSREDTRELRRIREQLKADIVPIPPRLGGVFVPNIIKSENLRPTSYAIFNDKGKQIAVARTGRKAFVFPGWYTIRIGGRATDLLPKYRVRVEMGKLTIIRPRWAALVVRVVDERLIQFRGTYDIIHLASRRGVGTGIGADGTLGEKVRPWLLQPGIYMIVRLGDNYLTRTNYFTVQVNQGEVTYFRLVSDRNNGNFLGGGVDITQKTGRNRKKSNWQWSLQLNGNFLWNQIENVQGTTSGHSFSLTAFLFASLAYNTKRHFFFTTLNTELGLTIPALGDWRKSSDRLELQSIYIFRLLPFLGPYVRLGVEVSMFPDYFSFGPDDLRLLESSSVFVCNPGSCRLAQSAGPGNFKQVQLSGVFDPFLFREGLGINFQAVRRSFLDLRLLAGLGFRQELAREVYQFNAGTDIADRRCRNASQRNPNNPLDLSGCPNASDQETHTTLRLFEKQTTRREGIEMALVATGRLTRFLSFTTEFDALIQFNFQQFKLDIDWRTAITLRLSQYAAIIYRLRVRRDSTLTPDPNDPEFSLWSIDQSVLLSFTLLL